MNRNELVKELVVRMENANVDPCTGGIAISEKYFEEVVKPWYLDCGDFGFSHRRQCTWDILVEYLGVTYKEVTHDEDVKDAWDEACEISYKEAKIERLEYYWNEWKNEALEVILGECQAAMYNEIEED